jgi:DNA-binding MarR family transcriptional regulator
MTTDSERRDQSAREAWRIMSDLVTDNERKREVSDVVGLSFGKLRTLRRVATGPVGMGELATVLVMDPPNLTAIVDDLEQLGLVERQPHPADRRARIVVATKAGAVLARRSQKLMDRPPSSLSDLPAEDLEALARILSRVRRETETE